MAATGPDVAGPDVAGPDAPQLDGVELAARLTLVLGRLNRRMVAGGQGLSHGVLSALSSIVHSGPLRLGDLQVLPAPGGLDIGDETLELVPADGHTHDGMAIWVGWAKVLIPGDYLSPVELPWLQEQGSREAYLATLGRLNGLSNYVTQQLAALNRPPSPE